jgi:hypothetical protein
MKMSATSGVPATPRQFDRDHLDRPLKRALPANGENQSNRVWSLYNRVIEGPAIPTALSTNPDAL